MRMERVGRRTYLRLEEVEFMYSLPPPPIGRRDPYIIANPSQRRVGYLALHHLQRGRGNPRRPTVTPAPDRRDTPSIIPFPRDENNLWNHLPHPNLNPWRREDRS